LVLESQPEPNNYWMAGCELCASMPGAFNKLSNRAKLKEQAGMRISFRDFISGPLVIGISSSRTFGIATYRGLPSWE